MTEAPTTQERYSRAVRSSSLRVEGEFVRGDADMLIAAGWCKSKFGAALMRLQAEWDGAERWGIKHPIKPTKRAIMVEAQVKFSMSAKVMKGKERPVVITKITKDCIDGHAEAEAAKVERAEARKRKEALKTRNDYQKEAQQAFNAFIRARDRLAGHVCISSGRALDWSGNQVDAGHYRSTGAAPHLRFNEDNCHAQSKHDNQYLSGNAVDYRIQLLGRIGLIRVEALESDNSSPKWTAEDLKAIRDMYRAKAKELKKHVRESLL